MVRQIHRAVVGTTVGRKVMVERSTYWANTPGARDAGANTIGGFSD